MKLYTYILSFISIVFISCNSSGSANQVTIEGNVKNCAPGFFMIMKDEYTSSLKRQTDTVYVNNDGSYSLTFKPGKSIQYKIIAGRNQQPVYLKPGTTNISFDFNSLQNSISFSNDFSKENKAFKEFKSKSPEIIAHIFYKRPVNEFLNDINKNHDFEIGFWKNKKQEGLDNSFIKIMEQEALISKTSGLVSYKAIYRWAKKQMNEPIAANEPQVPDNYYDFLKSAPISLNDTFLYYNSKKYRDYVSSIIYTVAVNETKKYFLPRYISKGNSNIVNFFNITTQLVNNKSMLNYVLANFLMPEIKFGRNFSDEMAMLLEKYKTYSNEDSKELIAFFYKQKKQMDVVKPGASAPDFNFKDINGKSISMNDLKGKYIYIDVWATWCAPCKREIPYLQKLENDFHNNQISFVSISVDQNKTAWENMVKSKGLKGIQLYAPPQQAQTFKDQYLISGIPRFILLDKEGKIINANAPRPSGNIRDIISNLKGI